MLERFPTRFRGRIALVALSLLVASPVGASPPPISGVRFRPPPGGDILGEWTKFRMRDDSAAHPLQPDGAYAGMLLAHPHDPYSPLGNQAFPTPGSAFDGQSWYGAVSVLRLEGRHDATTRMVAWDLGLTKATPGFQSPYGPGNPQGGPFSGASLVKAGVDIDVANQVSHLMGPHFIAAAANYAVALQLIRDRTNNAGRHDPNLPVPSWVALDGQALKRFMEARLLDELTDYDFYYLAKLMQSELSAWRGGATSSRGYRQLPVALRVARLAAAYRDALGYEARANPCDARGRGIPGFTPPDGALCFVDATDRAVHGWYRAELKRELSTGLTNAPHASALSRSVLEIGRMKPVWVGGLDRNVQALASHAEIVEWSAANQRAEEGSGPFLTRAVDLICRSATP